MATYDELQTLAGGNAIIGKIERAITIAADTIVKEVAGTPNHAARLVWAKTAFENPASISKAVFNAMLAANKTASVASITGASDSTIQTNVDAVIDVFAGA